MIDISAFQLLLIMIFLFNIGFFAGLYTHKLNRETGKLRNLKNGKQHDR